MLGFAAFGVAAVLAHPDWPRLLTACLVVAPDVVTRRLALLGAAATLGRHHHAAASAQDAARALRPLGGAAAVDLFAGGLVTAALVALPVVMASTGYVVGAHFNWRRGLSERRPRPALLCDPGRVHRGWRSSCP